MKLPMLAQDKANHVVYGIVVYTIINLLLYNVTYVNEISLMAAVFVGLAKEVMDYIDKKTPHTVDYKDFIATSIGGIFGYIISF